MSSLLNALKIISQMDPVIGTQKTQGQFYSLLAGQVVLA